MKIKNKIKEIHELESIIHRVIDTKEVWIITVTSNIIGCDEITINQVTQNIMILIIIQDLVY